MAAVLHPVLNGDSHLTNGDVKSKFRRRQPSVASSSSSVESDDETSGTEKNSKADWLVYENPDFLCDQGRTLLAFRREAEFCDVVLVVGPAEIPAHRAVLAAASRFLLDLFRSSDNERHFQLGGVDHQVFEQLVDFAYSGRLEIPPGQIHAAYRVALKLRMPVAAQACSSYLAQSLTPETCLEIRSFTNCQSDSVLASQADAFIQERIDDVLNTKQLDALHNICIEVLRQNTLEMDSASSRQLCELALQWSRSNLESYETLQDMAEHTHVLYIDEEAGLLRDFKEPDSQPSKSQFAKHDLSVQDYQKLCKQRRLVKKTPRQPETEAARVRMREGRRYASLCEEDVQLEEDDEWNVIASKQMSASLLLCICKLGQDLCKLALHLRAASPNPLGLSEGQQLSQADALSVDVNGSLTDTAPPTDDSGPESPGGLSERQLSLTPLAAMDGSRCGCGVAVWNDNIIVIGGYDRGECLDKVDLYDTNCNTWRSLNPMPAPRGRFDLAQFGSRLMIAGGSDGHSDLGSIQLYQCENDSWTQLPEAVTKRSNAGMACVGEHVYLVGGCSHSLRDLRTVERFSVESQQTQRVANLITARAQAAVAGMEGRVYACGGRDAWHCLASCEMYEPERDSWVQLPPMHTARRGAGIVAFNGKLYVVGGHDGNNSLRSTEVFDPATQTWTPGPMLGVPRANVALALVKGKIYAVGGFNGKSFLDTMEVYEAGRTDAWSPYAPPRAERTEMLDSSCAVVENGESQGESDSTAGGAAGTEDR